MSVNDAPAGGTGGPSGEPVPTPDLPEKMRVHALAKLLGRASKDVLGALTTLGHEVRSVQSNITRATAEQVLAALAPVAGEGDPEPSAAEPSLAEPSVAEPVEPVAAVLGQDTPAPERTGRRSGPRAAAHNPFGPADSGPAATRASAPAEPAAFAPAFAAPMFQAPTAPAAPAAPPASAPAGTEDGEGTGGGRKGRKGRKKQRDAEAPSEDEQTTAPAGDTAAEDSGDPADSDADSGGADSGDADRSEDDADGDARRRRRRGRRGRGRGKGGDEQGENDQDADYPESDSDDDGSGEGSGEETPAGSADSGDGDGDGDEQSSGGSRRRRRRRRKGGSDVEDRSEDDPPNTVTKVREARSDSGSSSSDDQVQGVRGSTRLEAKRQRRRDGRDAGRRRPPILSESEFLARRESVDRQMVIRQLADRTEIGVLEDSVLVEHFITGGGSGSSMVGNIYLGRVQNVLPSMEAAFVDIGRGRNAVLYAGEVNWDAAGLNGKARKIEQALSSGDQVLVQVTKDPVGHKGARLTTQISLAGRFLVYVPSGGAAGISRKLPDTERKRLKEMLKEIVPSEAGVIIRTASEGVSHDALERDVRRLQAQWEVVKEKSEKTGPGAPKAPTLLYEEPDMLVKVVRDQFNEDFSKLIVSGADAWDTVSGYVEHVASELTERMHRHTGPSDVFTEYRIDEQLLKALDRKVWLPSGGTLVIDRTEAMTVVDVNTGKFTGSGGNLEETVTRNNLEAAEEVVRQLRLRDIGGIIVVDFIDMVLEANRDLVLRRLTECLARDRTRHQVAEVTSLGLVQMTRKRVGGGLLEHFSTPCEHCRGRGVVISTDPAEQHQHQHNGNGNGRGGNDNDNGNGNNGGGNNGGGNGDGGGRRRRRRGGGDSGNGAPSGQSNGSDQGSDGNGQDRNGSDRNGSDHGSDRNGNGSAERSVDTTTAVAGVAAVAAAAQGGEGASAGTTVPATPESGTEPARSTPTGSAPAEDAPADAGPAPADTTVTDAAPAPPVDPDAGPAVAEPVGELTGSTVPSAGAEPAGRARKAEPAEPAEEAVPEAPAPRRRKVSRSAGAPVAAGEPVVITTSSPSGESGAGETGTGEAATGDAPATPDHPEAAEAVSRPRRRRRTASRPAGPPQDGG
jgi:ribonuclease E